MSSSIPLETFALFCMGSSKPESEHGVVLDRLANITKKKPEALQKWLLAKPTLIGKGLSSRAVQKTAKALRRAGLDVVIQLQIDQSCFERSLSPLDAPVIPEVNGAPRNWLYVSVEKIFPSIFAPSLEIPLTDADDAPKVVFKSQQFSLSRYVAMGSGMGCALLNELYLLNMLSGSFSSTIVTTLSLVLGAVLLIMLPKLLTPMLQWQLFDCDKNTQLSAICEQVCWHPLYRKFTVGGSDQAGVSVVYQNIFKPSELSWRNDGADWRVVKGSDTQALGREVAVDLRDALVELPVISTLVAIFNGFSGLAGVEKPALPFEDEPVLEIHDAQGSWLVRLYSGSPSAIVCATNNPQYHQSILVGLLALGDADV